MPDRRQPTRPRRQTSPKMRESARVLVVEDSEVDATVVLRVMHRRRSDDLDATVVPSIAAAIAYLETQRFDVILADLNVDDCEGVETVVRLRAVAPDTPIIVLTGVDSDGLAKAAAKAGAQDYLVKSDMNPRVLHRAMRYAIERKRQEVFLSQLATTDGLTGVLNRATFYAEVEEFTNASTEEPFALIFIDLDRFKEINDIHGHAMGDHVIREIGSRLKRNVRTQDLVGRLGGDEFALLLVGVQTVEIAELLCKRILRLISRPIEGRVTIQPEASIGAALWPEDGASTDDIIDAGDLAMYQAKRQRGSAFCLYREMERELEQSRRFNAELNRTADARGFSLHYQPLVDAKTGRIIAAEALLRWQRADATWVSPADFVPALEQSGRIVGTGKWVIETACAQLGKWQAEGRTIERICVNVSPVQFERRGLIHVVERAIASAGIAPHQLELEITEGTLMHDAGVTVQTLRSLKALGVRLAIDDFGTGYSSLAYLTRFNVDTLKIDRTFVSRVGTLDDTDRTLVSAIIDMGRRLGLEVVAEGIETADQASFLRDAGCTTFQGYYFARPAADLPSAIGP